jgi:fucose permease
MRNKTVHLLSLFLMVYIGVEVTIGGIIFVDYMIVRVTSLITVNQDGL